MDKNDIVEIEITGMTDDGSGVGRAEGIAVFVPYTIIGETARVLILKVNKKYAYGKLIEVISPSKHRVKAECPYFYKCGGCRLWHMDYDAELKYKHQKVCDCVRRIGGIDTTVSDIVGADNTKRYRNKMQIPVSQNGIGFYRRNSHDVIDMQDCLLQSEEVREIVDIVREWVEDCKIPVYDERSGAGVLRHIYTREGKSGVSVILVTAIDELPETEELVKRLTGSNLPICGIVQNINSLNTNVILGKRNKVLWGSGTVTDAIGNAEFEISPNSFYQVNHGQTEKLYSIAKRMANLSGKETVWDLYCGIGTIGQYMADKVGKLIGIEIVPQAVENAKKNAERNRIENAEYLCGAAETLAPVLLKNWGRPNVVILDPPRKGCDERLLDCVMKANPDRIVYVSCKASTLARDLKYLSKKYKTVEIVPVDMFPRTEHVESCVLLCRAW